MSEERIVGADDRIDTDELRDDLDAIKSAMGLANRYDGAPSLWLYFGVLVAVSAALSQVIHSARWPPWLHAVVWFGILGVGGAIGSRRLLPDRREQWPAGGHVPNVALQFVAIYLAVVPLLLSLAPAISTDGYVESSSLVLGTILVLVGVAYVVMGASMRAYRIRLRDRVPFYVGGVWIVGLGTAIPHVGLLREWGFAVFGGAYLSYALMAYGVLVWGEDA